MTRNEPARPPLRLLALLTFALLALTGATGCIERDKDVFFHGTNFEDKAAVTAVLDRFRDGVNGRDVDKLMSAFPASFRFPDAADPTLIHTFDTMRQGWRTFFERTEGIDYRYEDLFLRIDEANAQADLVFRRAYRGHAPFLHQVDDSLGERIQLVKDASGAWTIAALGPRLLPPTVYDR